jgi:hypothetical protein
VESTYDLELSAEYSLLGRATPKNSFGNSMTQRTAMKAGYLADFFDGVAAKRLAAVEVDTSVSNQHEFNAVSSMLAFLGRPEQPKHFSTRFVYLADDLDTPVVADAALTLYDSRSRQAHRSAEFRFYFPSNSVTDLANAGDELFLAHTKDDSLLAVICQGGSSASNSLRWLFHVGQLDDFKFHARSNLTTDADRLNFAARSVLENIGISGWNDKDADGVELLERFGGSLPSSRVFSEYARTTLGHLNPTEDPDFTLLACMEREELLFRAVERELVRGRLAKGFEDDVDGFLAFSLSVQNRRKSRVGLALENHVESILRDSRIRFARTARTERASKPDFLFPGPTEYLDSSFPSDNLLMLGVKSTCKDRWRQVLTEADRIEKKHLLTLETGISTAQTDEMRTQGLRLVVPLELHATFDSKQATWLLSFSEFLAIVKARQ